MPLDTNLLYGEMLASAIAHAAIPFATVLLISVLPYVDFGYKPLVFLVLCTVLSLFVQFAFMLILQVSACSGLNNIVSVGYGSLIGALISAIMYAIPVYLTPMRYMVSQLFMDHRVRMTSDMARAHEIVTKAALDLTGLQGQSQRGGALESKEYEEQTMHEISAGSSYWGAFAGAYGVALGSLIAATCPPPSAGASGP